MGEFCSSDRPLETPFSWKVVVAAIAIGAHHGRAGNALRGQRRFALEAAVVDQYRESRPNFSYRSALVRARDHIAGRATETATAAFSRRSR